MSSHNAREDNGGPKVNASKTMEQAGYSVIGELRC